MMLGHVELALDFDVVFNLRVDLDDDAVFFTDLDIDVDPLNDPTPSW